MAGWGARLVRWNPAVIYMRLEQAHDKALMAVVADAKKNAPVKTGQLRRVINVEKTSPFQGVVHANVKYAATQEFGSSKGVEGKFYITNAVQKFPAFFRVFGRSVFPR